jgi:hypothetical protein
MLKKEPCDRKVKLIVAQSGVHHGRLKDRHVPHREAGDMLSGLPHHQRVHIDRGHRTGRNKGGNSLRRCAGAAAKLDD